MPPPELDLPRVPAPRVSVFLSVLDVHVQRVPADGRVLDVQYRPGRFLSADLDKASEDNERNALLLETVETVVFTALLFSPSMEQRDLSAAADNAVYWYFMTIAWLPLAAIVFLSPYLT